MSAEKGLPIWWRNVYKSDPRKTLIKALGHLSKANCKFEVIRIFVNTKPLENSPPNVAGIKKQKCWFKFSVIGQVKISKIWTQAERNLFPCKMLFS